MRVVSPRLLAWIARAGFIGHPWRGGAVGRVKRARASGRDGQCDDRALLRQPLGGGLAVVIAVGLLCIAANVYGLRPTIGGDSRSVPPSALQGSGLAILHGTIGFLARSLVFILIGCFLIFAAWHTNAREATGFGGALLTLRSERYRNLLLLIAAAGPLAFGLLGASEGFGRAENLPSSAVRAKMNKMNGEF